MLIRCQQVVFVVNLVVKVCDQQYDAGAEDDAQQQTDAGELDIARGNAGMRGNRIVNDLDGSVVNNLSDFIRQNCRDQVYQGRASSGFVEVTEIWKRPVVFTEVAETILRSCSSV